MNHQPQPLLAIVMLILLTPVVCQANDESKPSSAARPRLGMNLSPPVYYGTELPFVDVFRLSRPWLSHKKGAGWAQGPELAIDDLGWVKSLEPDCYAEAQLCVISGGHYPSGVYTVLYEGDGEIEFGNGPRVVETAPGRMRIEVDSSKGYFSVQIKKTNPENYVRNIRVIMPGFEETWQQDPFHPVFLKRWQGMGCFRFGNWMCILFSKESTWEDRPTLQHATFHGRGVALEWMIELCNRARVDPWFCMPHLADDEFIRNFATMVKERLDPSRKIYIEYSNEVWNTVYPGTHYSWKKAVELNLGPKDHPWEGGAMYYAQRSVEIFKIWEEVFGGHERFVRVLAWQAVNTWHLERNILPHQNAHRQADALAIAPYILMSVPIKGKGLIAKDVENWTVDQVLTYVEKHALPKSIKDIQANKQVADRFGLKLIAYEGGHHMTAVGEAVNNEKLVALFHAAGAHPRMESIYEKYFNAWTNAGGDLFNYYHSIAKWHIFGGWGVMQYYDDDLASSPKMKGILRWARSCGQKVTFPDPATWRAIPAPDAPDPVEDGEPVSRGRQPESQLESEEAPVYRTFVDSSGKFSTEAAFVDFREGKVYLRKRDESETVIPIERLSGTDQEYVRAISGQHRK